MIHTNHPINLFIITENFKWQLKNAEVKELSSDLSLGVHISKESQIISVCHYGTELHQILANKKPTRRAQLVSPDILTLSESFIQYSHTIKQLRYDSTVKWKTFFNGGERLIIEKIGKLRRYHRDKYIIGVELWEQIDDPIGAIVGSWDNKKPDPRFTFQAAHRFGNVVLDILTTIFVKK